MNYKESKQILEEIKKAKKIISICHESPDFDSILSNLLLKKIIKKLGKNIELYSPEKLGVKNRFLDPKGEIKIKETNKIKLSEYDLLFALDVSDLKRLKINESINLPKVIVNIDHHDEANFGKISIFERDAGGTCSILYYLFKDWNIKFTNEELNLILLGLISDTHVFHFPYPSSKVFKRVTELIDEGGDYERALYYVSRCYNVMEFKYWAEAIKRIKIDKKYQFAYTVIPYSIHNKYKRYGVSSRQVSDTFLRNINDTNFGIVIIEDKDGNAKVSIRTRTPGYYVLDLIKQLGGEGHLTGGGASIKDKTFESAVNLVLEQARKYAKKE